MSSIKLGKVMIRKNIWLNVYISLFLALSLLSTVFTGLLIIDAKAIIKTYKPLEDENFVHFIKNNDGTSIYEFKERIDNLKGDNAVLCSFERTLYDDDYKGYNTMEMSKPLIETLDMSMSRGVWLSEVNDADETIIPACVGESLKHLFGQTIVLERKNAYSENSFSLKIVGVIDAAQEMPHFSSGPVIAFERISDHQKEDLIVFEDKITDRYDSTGLIVFSKGLSAEDKKNNIKMLSEVGNITDGKEIIRGTYRNYYDNINLVLPFSVLSCMLSVMAIIIIAGIVFDKNKKSMSVLLMAGKGSKDLFLSLFTYFAFILIFMTLFCIIGLVVINLMGVLSYARVGFAISLFSVYIAVVIMIAGCASYVVPKMTLAKINKEEL